MPTIFKVIILFEVTLLILWILFDKIYSYYKEDYELYPRIFQHHKALKISEICYNITNIIFLVNGGLSTLGGIIYIFYAVIHL